MDNRGAEINIANSVNIKSVVVRAGAVNVLLVVNYFSLKVVWSVFSYYYRMRSLTAIECVLLRAVNVLLVVNYYSVKVL